VISKLYAAVLALNDCSYFISVFENFSCTFHESELTCLRQIAYMRVRNLRNTLGPLAKSLNRCNSSQSSCTKLLISSRLRNIVLKISYRSTTTNTYQRRLCFISIFLKFILRIIWHLVDFNTKFFFQP
jgi:hypothetical protein